jgi:DNA-binding NtrC family response regulator
LRSSRTVLVTGETGTGKDLVARAIHQQSERAREPFIILNCATIPENLLESELFGHERGAFTGATQAKKGLLELAGEGTLFLDEISSMSLAHQVKLLRVLEHEVFLRVGGVEPLPSRARFVVASNEDLRALVRQGRFRRDLYYRLDVLRIDLPPLRERREDIPMLGAHFAARACAQDGMGEKKLEPEAVEELMAQPWLGNVRELDLKPKRFRSLFRALRGARGSPSGAKPRRRGAGFSDSTLR